MSDALFEVPNLDALPQKDLDDLMHVFSLLEEYSRLTARARRCRLNGFIEEACQLEKTAQGYYRRLPKNYRW